MRSLPNPSLIQLLTVSDRPFLVQTFEARMLLLLQLSLSRSGAVAILDANFLSAIRTSALILTWGFLSQPLWQTCLLQPLKVPF